MGSGNPTLERLEDQIIWYDQKSIVNQRCFKRVKVAEIVAAAVIPFSAGVGAPTLLTGGLGYSLSSLKAYRA